MKIKDRLYLTVLPLVLVPIVGIGIFSIGNNTNLASRLDGISSDIQSLSSEAAASYDEFASKLENERKRGYRLAVHSIGRSLDRRFNVLKRNIRNIAENEAEEYVLASGADFDVSKKYEDLRQVLVDLRISELSFVSQSGRELARIGEDPTMLKPDGGAKKGLEPTEMADFSNQGWFKECVQSNEYFSVSVHPRLRKGETDLALLMCVPVGLQGRSYSTGEIDSIGYLKCEIFIDNLCAKLLGEQYVEVDTRLRIDGKMIWPELDLDEIGEDRYEFQSPIWDGLATVLLRIPYPEFEEDLAAVAELADEVDSRAAMLENQVRSLEYEASRYKEVYFLLILSIALVAVAALLITARNISRPLASLRAKARKVKDGDLNTKIVSSDRIDEIDDLAAILDGMRRNLKHHIKDLDARVLGKTEELRDANLQLRSEVEERECAVQRAKLASEAKSEFLAMMSHEIRTPMNGVIGMADDLLTMNLTPIQHDRAETIKVSGEALMCIVDDILDFSKIEARKMEVKKESFDLHLACKTAHALFLSKAKEKNLQYSIDIDIEVPRFVVGDSIRFKQIISNLLSNAVKFTSEGVVDFKVRVDHDSYFPRLKFGVKDSGRGIAGEDQKKLFDAFAQLDDSKTHAFEGTGLGLAISKKLVELIGGEIRVESALGEGALFEFWFPMVEGKPVENAEELPQFDEPVVGARVLVVEDNRINQHVISSILEKASHFATVAENGEVALKLMEQQPFDLVFMDCRMPKLNGFEATKRIRQFSSDHMNRLVPIVALTANAFSEDRERCFASGMDNFLAKPVNREKLLQVVDYYCNQQVGEMS